MFSEVVSAVSFLKCQGSFLEVSILCRGACLQLQVLKSKTFVQIYIVGLYACVILLHQIFIEIFIEHIKWFIVYIKNFIEHIKFLLNV